MKKIQVNENLDDLLENRKLLMKKIDFNFDIIDSLLNKEVGDEFLNYLEMLKNNSSIRLERIEKDYSNLQKIVTETNEEKNINNKKNEEEVIKEKIYNLRQKTIILQKQTGIILEHNQLITKYMQKQKEEKTNIENECNNMRDQINEYKSYANKMEEEEELIETQKKLKFVNKEYELLVKLSEKQDNNKNINEVRLKNLEDANAITNREGFQTQFKKDNKLNTKGSFRESKQKEVKNNTNNSFHNKKITFKSRSLLNKNLSIKNDASLIKSVSKNDAKNSINISTIKTTKSSSKPFQINDPLLKNISIKKIDEKIKKEKKEDTLEIINRRIPSQLLDIEEPINESVEEENDRIQNYGEININNKKIDDIINESKNIYKSYLNGKQKNKGSFENITFEENNTNTTNQNSVKNYVKTNNSLSDYKNTKNNNEIDIQIETETNNNILENINVSSSMSRRKPFNSIKF